MTKEAAKLVTMSSVAFRWPRRDGFALSVGSFVLGGGEHILIKGPSGSGKTTLLSLMAGIASPQRGRIEVAGTDIARLGGAARDRFRAEHLGIIFQMFNLLPYGSVIDNVLLPLRFAPQRRRRAQARGDAADEARRLLSRLGLASGLIEGGPASRLSVGQQQRVAAARALIGAPALIIADEPTSALDPDRREAFLELMFAEARAAGAGIVMVSHDDDLARHFDRVVAMGEIIGPMVDAGDKDSAGLEAAS